MQTDIIIAIFLAIIILLLLFINSKLNTIMATSQERFDLIIGRLNTITSDIAADYKKLLDAIQNGDTITEESFAAAEANIAILETLGASVDNPVPPVEPPVG